MDRADLEATMLRTSNLCNETFKLGKVTGQIQAYRHAADICELNEDHMTAAAFRELARAAMDRRERKEF